MANKEELCSGYPGPRKYSAWYWLGQAIRIVPRRYPELLSAIILTALATEFTVYRMGIKAGQARIFLLLPVLIIQAAAAAKSLGPALILFRLACRFSVLRSLSAPWLLAATLAIGSCVIVLQNAPALSTPYISAAIALYAVVFPILSFFFWLLVREAAIRPRAKTIQFGVHNAKKEVAFYRRRLRFPSRELGIWGWTLTGDGSAENRELRVLTAPAVAPS